MNNLIEQALSAVQQRPKQMLYRLIDGQHMPVDLTDTYKGGAVFIIAGGPSLADMDLEALKQPGIMTFGLNNASSVFRPNLHVSLDQPAKFLTSVWRDPQIVKFAKMEWANAILWDQEKWDFGTMQTHECPNVIYFAPNEYKADVDDTWDERWFEEPHVTYGHYGKWWDESGPERVRRHGGGGRSVMMAAIKIASMIGFQRVYLVGTTFFMTAEKAYGFEQKVWESKVLRNLEQYVLMVSRLTRLGPAMKARGFEIINCTPNSHLTLFPCMDLSEAIERERIDTNERTGITDDDRKDHETESLYGKDMEAHDFTPDQIRAMKKMHAESTEEERSKGHYWKRIGEKTMGKSKGNGVCAVCEGRVWRGIK